MTSAASPHPAIAVCVVAAMAWQAAFAQEPADPERGLPLIRNFSPAMFDSPAAPIGAQALDLERLPDGDLLIATNEGLLRLGGSAWDTWNPLRGAVLSTAIGNDGRVFLGGVGDFGYFDRYGEGFISLKPAAGEGQPAIGEVWAVVATDEAVYYVDRERVWRWQPPRLRAGGPNGADARSGERLRAGGPNGADARSGERLRAGGPNGADAGSGEHLSVVYEGRGELRQAVPLGASAVVLDPGAGLVQLGANAAQTLPGSERVIGLSACALGPVDGGVASVCSDGKLIRWSTRGAEREIELDPTQTAALAEFQISTLSLLAPDQFAVGTRRGGLFLFAADGRLLARLSRLAGYDDTRIFSLLSLGVDGLWVGRDDGFALVEWPGQVNRYDSSFGIPPVPLGVLRHAGVVHIVTSRGVFRLQAGGNGLAQSMPVGLTDQVLFGYATQGEALFIAGREGLYVLTPEGPQRIDSRLSYSVEPIGASPPRLLVGGERSAFVLERDASGWKSLGELPGVRSEIRRIVAESAGVVWLSSRSARQLLRVDLGDLAAPSWRPQDARVEDYSDAASAPPGPVQPAPFPDGLVFGTRDGVYRFDVATRRFLPDVALNVLLSPERGELREALPLDAGRVLVAQHDRYRVLRREGAVWHEETTPLARVSRGALARSLYREDDGTLWVSTNEAVYRHRAAQQGALPSLPAPRVEWLTADGVVRHLAPHSETSAGVAPQRLSLRYDASVLVAADQLRFRSRLRPLEPEWSAWSENPARELAQVPDGDFSLEVQARDMFGRESEVSRVGLHLDPPWYLRFWALAGYVLLLAVTVALLMRWRERHLKARAASLETLVRERTRALDIASVTDQLTGLHNRRYFDRAAQQLRDARHEVLVALIDLDHFKRINDSLGHEAGDCVLQTVATRLVDAVPRGAVLFRWGGEEFLLLAPLPGGSAHAPSIAQSLLDRIGAVPVELELGDALPVSCSIGWAIAGSTDEVPMREALRLADLHLYAAKSGGRDRAHGPAGLILARNPG